MSNNVIVLPKIMDQVILAKYYSMADVFVICSKKENFPTTCLEAQCCGTPVIGFDTGGTAETSIYDKKDFVEYGNLEKLSIKVQELLDRDTKELEKKAQSMYSKKVMFQNYIKKYDENNRKNRILLIDVNCKQGSTGKIVYDLYQELKKKEREVAICYGRGPIVNEENIYKFGIDIETKFHALMARITGYNGYFSFFSTRRLIKYIEEFKPDLIHIHELHAYFVNINELINYIKEKNIPVIWTFHCEYMYTGKCGYANECKKYQNSCEKCPAVYEYPKSIFFDQTKKMFQDKKRLLSNMNFTVVTPSNWLANRVKKSFLKNKNIEVIHNGIDTNIFKYRDTSDFRKQLGIPQKNKIILAVAPNIMSDRKGGKWILELAKKFENKNFTFILIGDSK